MKAFVRISFVVTALLLSEMAFAHSGGLDAKGCHTNSKTGDHHCHRAVTPPQALASPPYYRNCAAVRAAGKAPLMRGSPGYAPHLDRDDDGIACE